MLGGHSTIFAHFYLGAYIPNWVQTDGRLKLLPAPSRRPLCKPKLEHQEGIFGAIAIQFDRSDNIKRSGKAHRNWITVFVYVTGRGSI